jgi:hypothetical protein
MKMLILHSANGIGNHFLDWSLNFFSGTISTLNPLRDNTAHGHQITQIAHKIDLDSTDLPLICQTQDTLHTLAKEKFNSSLGNISVEQREEIKSLLRSRIQKLIDRCSDLSIPVIAIDWSDQHWLLATYENRLSNSFSCGKPMSRTDLFADYLENFFPGAKKNWSDQHIWDQREQLALCIRPLDLSETIVPFVHGNNVLKFTSDNVWYDLENCLIKMLSSCDITPRTDLLEIWRSVYNKWQKIHDTKFSIDYWKILDHIYHGKQLNLSEYKINFIKEALIQHGLIFRYNLNVSTWNLEKLPSDCKDIHNILEPNIHERNFCYL